MQRDDDDEGTYIREVGSVSPPALDSLSSGSGQQQRRRRPAGGSVGSSAYAAAPAPAAQAWQQQLEQQLVRRKAAAAAAKRAAASASDGSSSSDEDGAVPLPWRAAQQPRRDDLPRSQTWASRQQVLMFYCCSITAPSTQDTTLTGGLRLSA